jgi:hypothetical protein
VSGSAKVCIISYYALDVIRSFAGVLDITFDYACHVASVLDMHRTSAPQISRLYLPKQNRGRNSDIMLCMHHHAVRPCVGISF